MAGHEALSHRDEDQGGYPGGHHRQGEDLLVPRGLGRVPQPEDHDEIDGRDHDHEPEGRQDLDQQAATLLGQASASPIKSPSGMNTVPPTATAPRGPGHPTNRWRTAAIRATSAASTAPIPNHCSRSRSWPDSVRVAEPHRDDRHQRRPATSSPPRPHGQCVVVERQGDACPRAST